MNTLFEKLRTLHQEENPHVTEYRERQTGLVIYTFYITPRQGGSFFSVSEKRIEGLSLEEKAPFSLPYPNQLQLTHLSKEEQNEIEIQRRNSLFAFLNHFLTAKP